MYKLPCLAVDSVCVCVYVGVKERERGGERETRRETLFGNKRP